MSRTADNKLDFAESRHLVSCVFSSMAASTVESTASKPKVNSSLRADAKEFVPSPATMMAVLAAGTAEKPVVGSGLGVVHTRSYYY